MKIVAGEAMVTVEVSSGGTRTEARPIKHVIKSLARIKSRCKLTFSFCDWGCRWKCRNMPKKHKIVRTDKEHQHNFEFSLYFAFQDVKSAAS